MPGRASQHLKQVQKKNGAVAGSEAEIDEPGNLKHCCVLAKR